MEKNISETPPVVPQKNESIINWSITTTGLILITVFVKAVNPFIQIFTVNIFNKNFGLVGFILDAGTTLLIALIVGFIIKKNGLFNGLFLGITTLIIALFVVIPSSQIGLEALIPLSLALTLPAIIGCIVGSLISKSKIVLILLIILIVMIVAGPIRYLSKQGVGEEFEKAVSETLPTTTQVVEEEGGAVLKLTKDEKLDDIWEVFVSEKHGFQITLQDTYQPQETENGLNTLEIIKLTSKPASTQSGLSIKITDEPISEVILDLKAEYSELEEETALNINGLQGTKLTFHLEEYPFAAIFYIVEDKNKTFIIESHHDSDEMTVGTFLLVEETPKIKRKSDE